MINLIKKTANNSVGYWLVQKITQILCLFLGIKISGKEAKMINVDNKKALGELPKNIENFEDLAWLFFSNFLNHKIIRMTFEEAAYVYRTIRKNKPVNLIEIGTWEGGGTILISTAKSKEARFTSIDLNDTCNLEIKKLLDKNTVLALADSKKFTPLSKIDFILIDGDHTFEGIKADFEHFTQYLNQGADVLFHDAAYNKYNFNAPAVIAYIKTAKTLPNLKLIGQSGSIVHFQFINKNS